MAKSLKPRTMRLILAFALVSGTLPSSFATNAAASVADSLDFVKPLIGSRDGGNVFAGATLPYGLAKAVADVDGQNTGGFSTDGSNVTGFSSMHDSGTGGNPSLGNFPLFPQVCPGDDINNCRFRIGDRKLGFDNATLVSQPGYFALDLLSGVKAEMTVSKRTALFKFTFGASDATNMSMGWNTTTAGSHPMVMLDLTDLWQSRQNASINIDPKTGRMKGNGTFLPSFGAGSYMSYFCVDFFGGSVHDSGVWVNNRAGTEPKEISVTRGLNLFFLEAGGFVRFGSVLNNTVTARMGMSFKSAAQACRSAETEIPDPIKDFDKLVQTARNAWSEKMSVVTVDPGGASEDMQKTFWSGLYRAMISPQNYTGENPHWDSGLPYFDSYYWWVSRVYIHQNSDADMVVVYGTRTGFSTLCSLLLIPRHRGKC